MKDRLLMRRLNLPVAGRRRRIVSAKAPVVTAAELSPVPASVRRIAVRGKISTDGRFRKISKSCGLSRHEPGSIQ